MKNSILALLICFSSTLTFGQWDIIATQATAPDALAVDSCGNAFARVANRVYRSADMGQTWDAVLDIPTMLNPSILMDATGGTMSVTAYSTRSGLMEDFRILCDGTIRQRSLSRGGYCASYGLQTIRKDRERILYFSRVERLIGVNEVPLAYDSGNATGIVSLDSGHDSEYLFQISNKRISGGLTRVSRIPNGLITPSNPQAPQITQLQLATGWDHVVSEQEGDLNFANSSMIIGKRSAGRYDSISIVTYIVSTGVWTNQFVNADNLNSVEVYKNNQFLFVYNNRIELREANASASLIRTIQLPLNFQVSKYSSDLNFLIGTIGADVVILNNGTPFTTASLPRGVGNWVPTLSGTVLVDRSTEFTSGGISTPIDLDASVRYISVDSVGDLVYLVRQLRDRQQLLVENADGTLDVVIDSLDGPAKIYDGDDNSRVIRIGSANFRLDAGVVSPIVGLFSDKEIQIHGADTLYVERLGDTTRAMVKRGTDFITLSERGYPSYFSLFTPLHSGDHYFVTTRFRQSGPDGFSFSSEVFDVTTLTQVERIGHKGRLSKVGGSLFFQRDDETFHAGNEGSHSGLTEVFWNGTSIDFNSVSIPTFKNRSVGETCRGDGGYWLGADQVEHGFHTFSKLNGVTFISGIHGVYGTEECLGSTLIRQEQICLEDGQSIIWNGQVVDVPGLYVDSSSTENSCLTITTLTAGQTLNVQITECFLESNGNVLGVYVTNSTDAAGCAQRQELTITPPDTFRLDTMVMLGEILFGEEVVSNGQQISTSRDVADCTEIVIYTVSLVSSTSQVNGAEKLSVYPTLLGADRTFQIETAGQKILNVEVFTLSGKQVNVYQNSDQWQLDTPQAGWYIVRIQTDQGSSNTRILVN